MIMLAPLPLRPLLAAPEIAVLICLWPADLVVALILLLLPLLLPTLLLFLTSTVTGPVCFLTLSENVLGMDSLGSL